MANQHSVQGEQHTQHRVAHEQLKRRHHNIIAHWNVLLKTLQEAAKSPAVPAKAVSPS
jgi:hypothetical protein